MPLAIQPQDFSQRVTDVNRETWTLGTMRSVIKALNGAEVSIVTDKATGSAKVGTLIKCFDGGAARGPRVAVETEYATREIPRANDRLADVGIIIVEARG